MSDSNVMQPHTRVLQHVPRWGIIRTIRQQSVAEHSYYVTLYAGWIAQFLGRDWPDVLFILEHALTHDFNEMVTGDIPQPYKKCITDVKDTKICSASRSMMSSIHTVHGNNQETCKKIIKVADLFEACMYLKDEMGMGNSTVSDLYQLMITSLFNLTSALSEDLWVELQSHLEADRTRTLTQFGLK